jgi:hypothetical protein
VADKALSRLFAGVNSISVAESCPWYASALDSCLKQVCLVLASGTCTVAFLVLCWLEMPRLVLALANLLEQVSSAVDGCYIHLNSTTSVY